jgi:aryl-alcohol dehydrogenase-like predicted oxidoreductase
VEYRLLGRSGCAVYQVHAWDPLTPIEETLRFLDDAVRAGKIHYVGLSNFTGWCGSARRRRSCWT